MIGVIASMQSEMAFEKECEKKGNRAACEF
jgi:hypothetical protein